MSVTAPLWFGPDERPLFGWVSAPDNLACRAGVLLCLPIGEEVRTTHRAMRKLASALADAGFASILFDYDGTGNSAGRLDDPDRPAAWAHSVRAAATVLRDMGVDTLSAVGLRMGATILTACAAELDLDALVLWDPCATGRHFIREQQALHRTGAVQPPPRDDDRVELPEYLLDADTAAQISAMDLVPVDAAPPSRRLLAVVRPDRALPRRARAWIAACGAETAPAPEQDTMLADYNGGYVPEPTVGYIAGWLGGVTPLTTRPVQPPQKRPEATFADGPAEARESIVSVGPVGLFGITCEPVTAAPAPGTVILISASTEHSIGPARLWVELSRRWAARGIRTVRFDLSGVGFSPTRPGQLEHEPYASEWLDDLADVVGAYGPAAAVTLVGLCSGGYGALESGRELGVGAACAVNPILTSSAFHSKSTMVGPRRRVVRRMPWLLARLERRFPEPVRLLWDSFTQVVPSRAPMAGVAEVARAGVDTLLVTCELDAAPFRRNLYWRLIGEPRLRRHTRYDMVVVAESDHALRIANGRERAVAVIDDYVIRHHPPAAPYDLLGGASRPSHSRSAPSREHTSSDHAI